MRIIKSDNDLRFHMVVVKDGHSYTNYINHHKLKKICETGFYFHLGVIPLTRDFTLGDHMGSGIFKINHHVYTGIAMRQWFLKPVTLMDLPALGWEWEYFPV